MNDYVLRPYQKECVDAIDQLPDGSKVIVALATGLGKSVCFSHIKRSGRLLILSNRDELVYQPQKYFSCSFGIEKAEQYSNGEDVVSASIQTLSMDHRLKRFHPEDFEIIVVDECHHSVSPTYKRVLSYFKPKKLIGFTATPTRGDGTKLDDIYDSIIYSKDLLWGIQQGYLCKIKSLAITPKIDISNVQMLAGDYNVAALANAIDHSDMYQTIANAYRDYAYTKQRHCLIYCIDKKSCYITREYITRLLPDEEDYVKVITGNTPSAERHQTEQDFLDGTVHCIINCMVLTEGVDLPAADTIIVARPSANPTLYTQIIGRGTRLSNGKDHCLVLDILPKSSHKLCSITTLAGCDFKDLPPHIKDKLRSNETDLEDMINLINQTSAMQQDTLSLFVQEYDIVNGCYMMQHEILAESFKKGETELIQTLCKKEKNGKKQAIDYGITNFYGMHYQIGMTDSSRFIIQGDTDNYLFTISEPDILGHVSVQALINHILYTTETPIPADTAMQLIRKILQAECQNLFFWNQDVIEAWNDMPATKKQLAYIRRCSLNMGFGELKIESEISKYVANILIKNITQYQTLKKRSEHLKWMIDRGYEKNTDASTEFNLILTNGISLNNTDKTENFLKLRCKYGKHKINDHLFEEMLKPGTLEIPKASALTRSALYKLRTLSTSTLKFQWAQLLKRYKTDVVLYDISKVILQYSNDMEILTRLFLVAQAIMSAPVHTQYEPIFYVSDILQVIDKPIDKWKWVRLKYHYAYLDKWRSKKTHHISDNILKL